MVTVKRKEAISNICKEFETEILYIFGSRSKEVADFLDEKGATLTPGSSDVDVGVKLSPAKRLSVKEKALLAVLLEDLLGVNRVDLVILTDADPFLAADVIRGERVFARDEDEANEYELFVLRRAGDLIPLEKERLRLIFKEAL